MTFNPSSQDINGILSGEYWATNSLTFSFPTAASNYGDFYGVEDGYGGNDEPYVGFNAISPAQQSVVGYALNLISQYTLLTFTQITETDSDHAELRFADSGVPETSWAYSPFEPYGGDVWFGNIAYEPPTKGSYAFNTILHEIGHAVGLKHGQEYDPVYGVLPPEHNSAEWSLMTYNSYIGATGDYYENAEGSGNQTYMIDDIAALQYMYGANFNTYAGNTVYTWSPTTGETFIDGVGQGASSANKVYEAIWDGGGIDTYNLSNYSTDLYIQLDPGEWSIFSTAQLADLDGLGTHLAVGNVANAYLYNGDPRSLIENAIGGSGDDVLIGNVANNTLAGGAGDDILVGYEGNDTLAGTVGNDKLDGGVGNDTINGGAAGSDTAGYLDAGSAVNVSLALQGSAQNTIGAGIDTLSNMENLDGSDFNDTLTGDANANVLGGLAGNDALSGGAGNDVLWGEVGNDTLSGGSGNDTIDGGAAGSDTATYADATAGVTVSLAITTAQNTVGAGTDTVTNIENLTGSNLNDTLTGNTAANFLNGGAGNDTLSAGAGNDALIGGVGNDALAGGAGNDSLDGGAAGSDTASYFDATAGVTVNLALAAAQNTIGAGTDTLFNFENLTGSNFNDTLSGNSVANILNGGAGSDTLIGSAGNDTLVGGVGNDAINGGAGNDSMDGSAGTDTISYSAATAGVTVNLAVGTAQNTVGSGTDTLFNFENLTGSNFNDKLTGNAAANTLYGLGGNDSLNGAAGIDTLSGAAGNDRLIGGAGNDSLDGGVGTDSFVFDKAFGKDTITGFVAAGAGHDTIDFSTATFGSFAAIKSHMVQSGANVVITLDSADTITLKSVTLASLTAADFTFHPGTAPAAPAYLAASPSASPDSSQVNVASMASTASDHTWLDHSVHANALTMFG